MWRVKHLVFCLFVTGSVYAQDSTQPSPFTWEQRWDRYMYRTYSWQRMSWLAFDSALDHFMDEPKQWGRKPASFSYRYGAAFGSRIVRNSMELGLGAALREDLRFMPSHESGLRNRIRYAVKHAFLAGRPDGSFAPAYARFAATAGGVLVGSQWYPERMSTGQFIEGVGFGMLDQVQNSLLTEFSPDMKRIGTRVRKAVLRH